MTYVIEGLAAAPFLPLYGLDDAALAARNARRMAVDAAPGYPCRITLEEATPGETVILLNHVSREGATPYRASHAIFGRERASWPARFVDAVPPEFAPRVLSLRGFDTDGMMVDARISHPGEAHAGLLALFANERVAEVDVHNATRGCFAARARRAA